MVRWTCIGCAIYGAIPLPGYTDYLNAFRSEAFSLSGEQFLSLEQVDAAPRQFSRHHLESSQPDRHAARS
jgi:hypothetical protein